MFWVFIKIFNFVTCYGSRFASSFNSKLLYCKTILTYTRLPKSFLQAPHSLMRRRSSLLMLFPSPLSSPTIFLIYFLFPPNLVFILWLILPILWVFAWVFLLLTWSIFMAPFPLCVGELWGLCLHFLSFPLTWPSPLMSAMVTIVAVVEWATIVVVSASSTLFLCSCVYRLCILSTHHRRLHLGVYSPPPSFASILCGWRMLLKCMCQLLLRL